MLKFMRGRSSHASAERLKLQKELFGYRKTVSHGFPAKPTAFAYDKTLGLLAIADKSGGLIVVGQPGVEFFFNSCDDGRCIIKIAFITQKCRMITLSEENLLCLYGFNGSSLVRIKSCNLRDKIKPISCFCLKQTGEEALIGTEGGSIHIFNVAKCQLEDKAVYLDAIMKNGPENYKLNPGAVERVLLMNEDCKILIGFERGLIALWDWSSEQSLQYFVSSQQLEDLTWVEGPENGEFAVAHNDGSYVVWSLKDSEKPFKEANTPYGPFPCKRIEKIKFWQSGDGQMLAFSGGMPRATLGDHYTVTVKSEEKDEKPHVTFDLTSKVIDFCLVYPYVDENENSEGNRISEKESPTALLILAEEELVAIDLRSPEWPVYYPHPYLNCIHPSPVTCFHHVSQLEQEVFSDLLNISVKGEYSKNPWPIFGGRCSDEPHSKYFLKSVLITGHEDGSVRFWDSSSVCFSLLAAFGTSQIFSSDELDIAENGKDEDEEEWPPFRKVGTFDPYSDDPRLAVKKLEFCRKTGVLLIGGTAGQVVVITCKNSINTEPSKLEINSCNLVADKDSFVWKGHSALEFRPKNNPNMDQEDSKTSFTINALLQVHPPASITALSLDAPGGVAAVGTAHGIVLYDFLRKKVVLAKSTLNPLDIMATGDMPISRRKSIKKSLRESFRRLRKGRSQRDGNRSTGVKSASALNSELSTKPMERAIEARGADESMSSMVRSVTLSRTNLISLQNTTATLWAGTNAGTVYAFVVNVPGGERRTKEDVRCQLAKEIQLKHRAPVLAIMVIDCNHGLVDGFSPQHDHLGPHKVLICSEEQIKIFALPSLRPFGKLKLTALEGARIRKIAMQTFTSVSDASYKERCLSCLTNQGELIIISVPDLRKQVIFTNCLRREDISGIHSLVFKEDGEAFYAMSSSELQRLSLSARVVTKPTCFVKGQSSEIGPLSYMHNNSSATTTTTTNHDNSLHNDNNAAEKFVEDVISDIADITIDSVRDLTSSNTSVEEPSFNEERGIDTVVTVTQSSTTVRTSHPPEVTTQRNCTGASPQINETEDTRPTVLPRMECKESTL